MRRLRKLLIALTLAISWKASALTIILDCDLLKDSSAAPMPTTGLVLLVASTNDSTFNGPTPLNFVSGDDVIIGKIDLSAFGTPGVVIDTVSTTVPLTAANPLRLYWFPTLNINSTAPGQGTPYGTYTDAVGIDGSAPWFGASASATINLKFLTSDADPNYHNAGSNPASAGNASQNIPTPIVINTQPASTTQGLGTTANFSVDASGTALTYQWRKNGVNLTDGGKVSGATTANLTLSNVNGLDAASYSVFITNSSSFVTSSSATLTVIDPAITSQPASITVNAASTANFSVTATGTGTLTYQWKKGGVTINNGSQPSGSTVSGATTTALTISGVQQGDAANYTAVVTGTGGNATSSAASLTVTDVAPSFTTPTTATTNILDAGDQIVLTASATGTTPISYQWKKGVSNLSNGSFANGATVSGATSSSLTLTGVRASDAGDYICSAQNTAGNNPSATTTIIVSDPVIVGQPGSFTAGCNGTGWQCLNVNAVGSTNLSYQWYVGSTAIVDATNATMCWVDNTFASAGSYYVIVSNVYGNSITSSVATVTVTDTELPVINLNDTSPLTVCKDSAYTEPGATADDACDGLIPINPIGTVNTSTVGSYTITYSATDSHGNAATAYRIVNVQDCSADPSITKQPTNQVVVVGQKGVTFDLTASGTPQLRYQWFKKTNSFMLPLAIKKQTNSVLPLAAITPKDQGTYFCIVTNGVGDTVTSQIATLTVYPSFYVEGPGNQTKIAGNIAIFKATGRPPKIGDPSHPEYGGPFTFKWTRIGVGDVVPGGDIVINTTSNTSTLTIFNVQSEDVGTYLCTVGTAQTWTNRTAPNDGAHGLLTVKVDSAAPTASILHPNNGLKTTNGQAVLISASQNTHQANLAPEMDIDGSAADTGMITNVALIRNEDNLSINVPLVYKTNLAGLMKPGAVLWTNRVTLLPGTNTYRVVASDTANLPSAGTAKRQFFFCTNVPVTINVSGTGKVTGTASPFGKPVVGANSLFDQIGYKLTASKTVSSKQFRGWHTNGSPVISLSPTFPFVASSNLVITADFDP